MTSTRKAVSTDDAPAAIGPYSQAVRVGELAFYLGSDSPQTGRFFGNGRYRGADAAGAYQPASGVGGGGLEPGPGGQMHLLSERT